MDRTLYCSPQLNHHHSKRNKQKSIAQKEWSFQNDAEHGCALLTDRHGAGRDAEERHDTLSILVLFAHASI